MTSETRVNLIALAVIVAVMMPGAVILFQKKMRPGARAILGQPDPVRRVVPYMEPLETPVHERVVPPATWAWVEGLARQFGVERPLVEGTRPVMSERRLVQVLDANPTRAVLLVWKGVNAASLRAEPGKIQGVAEQVVPAEVRKELQEAGYIDPAKKVAVVDLALADKQAGRPIRIRIKQEDGNGKWDDFVTLFTSPDNTNK